MVIIFFFFGYQKWFAYEAERLIPYISNGPLIFWLYPVFGMRGASLFLGASEWTFGTLIASSFLSCSSSFLIMSSIALPLVRLPDDVFTPSQPR